MRARTQPHLMRTVREGGRKGSDGEGKFRGAKEGGACVGVLLLGRETAVYGSRFGEGERRRERRKKGKRYGRE